MAKVVACVSAASEGLIADLEAHVVAVRVSRALLDWAAYPLTLMSPA